MVGCSATAGGTVAVCSNDGNRDADFVLVGRGRLEGPGHMGDCPLEMSGIAKVGDVDVDAHDVPLDDSNEVLLELVLVFDPFEEMALDIRGAARKKRSNFVFRAWFDGRSHRRGVPASLINFASAEFADWDASHLTSVSISG